MRNNLDHMVTADVAHPISGRRGQTTGEPSPYLPLFAITQALILPPHFYELVAIAEEERRGEEVALGVWSSGVSSAWAVSRRKRIMNRDVIVER